MTPDASAELSPLCAHVPVSAPSRFWQTRPVQVQLALLVAIFSVVWTATLVLTSASPPGDNIEQLLWVQALQWGYYKHPPLPTWLIWIPVGMFGRDITATYVAAALTNLASFAIFWQLMRRLRGPHFAFIAVLAALCISYYNVRFTTYNHNTVLMLVSTASAALSWQACTNGRLRWWIGLGLMLGLGLLTKYQIAVTIASFVAFWVYQGGWKRVEMRQGLMLTSLIALLMFVPHLQWLRDHDFGPVGYAIESSLGADLTGWARLLDVLNWLADQMLNRALAAWLLLIVVAAAYRRARRPASAPLSARVTIPPKRDRDSARAFLLCWGLTPLVFMPLVGLLAGSHLHLPWGTAFLLFAVPMVMELSGSRIRWNAIPLDHATRAFLAVQAASLMLNVVTSDLGPRSLRTPHWSNFDGASMARQLEPALRKALAGTAVVAIDGPEDIAGALSLQLPERPLVVVDGRLDRSPGVSPSMLTRGPTLHVRDGSPIPAGSPVSGAYSSVSWWLSWPAPVPAVSSGLAPVAPAFALRKRTHP